MPGTSYFWFNKALPRPAKIDVDYDVENAVILSNCKWLLVVPKRTFVVKIYDLQTGQHRLDIAVPEENADLITRFNSCFASNDSIIVLWTTSLGPVDVLSARDLTLVTRLERPADVAEQFALVYPGASRVILHINVDKNVNADRRYKCSLVDFDGGGTVNTFSLGEKGQTHRRYQIFDDYWSLEVKMVDETMTLLVSLGLLNRTGMQGPER